MQQKAEEDNNITEMLPDDTTVCVGRGTEISSYLPTGQGRSVQRCSKYYPTLFWICSQGPKAAQVYLWPFFLLLASASAAAALEKQHFCFF